MFSVPWGRQDSTPPPEALADLHCLSLISLWVLALVGAVQIHDVGAWFVSSCPLGAAPVNANTYTGVETWKGSDILTEVFSQTLLVPDNVVRRKHFFCKCTFFHLACVDVLAQAFSGMAVSRMPLEIWFWIYFSTSQFLWNLVTDLFLVVSQITFHLTPPALPAYISIFFFPPWSISALSEGSAALDLEFFVAATKFYLFVFAYLKLCTHLFL